jgi:peptidoglycan/xylan/chitin deacetylase (PgdA/CDA1 family)
MMIQAWDIRKRSRRDNHKVNVMLTVDTEFWPDGWRLDASNVDAAYERDVLGRLEGEQKEYGLPFLLSLLEQYGLHAVFFIEALSSQVVGDSFLRDMVSRTHAAGQEVQMHLHPEWPSGDSRMYGGQLRQQYMHQFSSTYQEAFIADALEILADCGAPEVNAFRAGSYGAGNCTLRALAKNGIQYDTSYNLSYLDGQCQIHSQKPLFQPVAFEGVIEFPITCFTDWPGHVKHAQLCATSYEELSYLLLQAWEQKETSFVIVLHSFECLSINRTKPDPTVIHRMESLCSFLDEHRDKFDTCGFRDLAPESVQTVATDARPRFLQSTMPRTLRRMREQLLRRVDSLTELAAP